MVDVFGVKVVPVLVIDQGVPVVAMQVQVPDPIVIVQATDPERTTLPKDTFLLLASNVPATNESVLVFAVLTRSSAKVSVPPGAERVTLFLKSNPAVVSV